MASDAPSPPRLLVQLSDPHIKSPGALAYGRVDTAAYLQDAVNAINALNVPPVAVLITGDLTDFGRPAEYAHLRQLLQPLRCPVYLMPGNHDDRLALRQAFPSEVQALTSETDDMAAFIQYAIDLGGLQLITLDTTVPGAPHGELCPRRLAWLDARLAAAPNMPAVVAMHHPPFITGIAHMDEIGLREGAKELAELVGRHPQVERVVCGHLHRSIQVRWAGTLAMTAPSTAHQVCLDLDSEGPSAFTMEPPGFLVHAWGSLGRVVSHTLQVGRFPGPFPFHAEGELID